MLNDLLKEKKLICYLGNGGVGKTTVSAATALELSKERSVLVMTVDPARRLANSLGLKELGYTPTEIKENLYGLMVDSKSSLDQLIKDNAPSKEKEERILKNMFYQTFSHSFTGMEDFISAGVLTEVVKAGTYDTVIVDTAPSSHGIDFLQSPEKVRRVFDSGLMKTIFSQDKWYSNPLGKLLHMGITKKIISTFNYWTTDEFIGIMMDFIDDFSTMDKLLKKNADDLGTIIKDNAHTACAIVTAGEAELRAETLFMYDALKTELSITPSYVVVNRVKSIVNYTDVALMQAYGTPDAQIGYENTRSVLEFHNELARRDASEIASLKEKMPVPFYTIPSFERSISSMAGLERVAAELFRRP